MRHWSRGVLVVLVGVLIAGVGARGQPQPASAVQAKLTPTLAFAPRLTALDPREPEAYLLLAEDVLDAGAGPEHRALAARLLVLTHEWDVKRDGPPTVAVSACLALADILPLRADRESARSIANHLDPRRAEPLWGRRKPPATSEATDYQAAVAVGLARSGDGGFARQLFRKPEVRDRLAQLDRVARRAGVSGGVDDIIREGSRWPCPVCGNLRVERRGPQVSEFRFCSNCKGRPGTRLSRADYLAQLRFESWLLAGTQRGWAAQSAMDQGAPLANVDLGSLAALVGIDASAPYFREGRWVTKPEGE